MATPERVIDRDLPADRYEPYTSPSGASLGRVATLCSQEQGAGVWAGLWVCGPGEHTTPFEANEVFYLIEGRADVAIGSERLTLEPGQGCHFRRGETAVWSVGETLKTFVVACDACED